MNRWQIPEKQHSESPLLSNFHGLQRPRSILHYIYLNTKTQSQLKNHFPKPICQNRNSLVFPIDKPSGRHITKSRQLRHWRSPPFVTDAILFREQLKSTFTLGLLYYHCVVRRSGCIVSLNNVEFISSKTPSSACTPLPGCEMSPRIKGTFSISAAAIIWQWVYNICTTNWGRNDEINK